MLTPRQRKTLERLQRVCENAWAAEVHWIAHEAVYQVVAELDHLLGDDALGTDTEGPTGARSLAEGPP